MAEEDADAAVAFSFVGGAGGKDVGGVHHGALWAGAYHGHVLLIQLTLHAIRRL